MSQYLKIHPVTPQKRLIQRATEALNNDGILVYPTDTTYGLGCGILNRRGVERILKLKQLPSSHQLSIICPNLSDISRYARVDNKHYRILKRYLPGPYTFILKATREVPKTLLPRRKTIGLRVPDHPIVHALVSTFGLPLLSTSLRLPGETKILSDPLEIRERVIGRVDLVIDGGPLSDRYSTMVDLTGDAPELLRIGVGDPRPFQ